jgi:hypothetical protein
MRLKFTPISDNIEETQVGPCRIVVDNGRGIYLIQISNKTIESGKVTSKESFKRYLKKWLSQMGLYSA